MRRTPVPSHQAKETLPSLAVPPQPAHCSLLSLLLHSSHMTPFSALLLAACLPCAVGFPILPAYSSGRYLSSLLPQESLPWPHELGQNLPIHALLAPYTYLCSHRPQFSFRSFCDHSRNACLPHQTPGWLPCLSSPQHPSTWHLSIYPWNGSFLDKSEKCLFLHQGNLNFIF